MHQADITFAPQEPSEASHPLAKRSDGSINIPLSEKGVTISAINRAERRSGASRHRKYSKEQYDNSKPCRPCRQFAQTERQKTENGQDKRAVLTMPKQTQMPSSAFFRDCKIQNHSQTIHSLHNDPSLVQNIPQNRKPQPTSQHGATHIRPAIAAQGLATPHSPLSSHTLPSETANPANGEFCTLTPAVKENGQSGQRWTAG
jgi:hypothetical protein